MTTGITAARAYGKALLGEKTRSLLSSSVSCSRFIFSCGPPACSSLDQWALPAVAFVVLLSL